MIAKDRPTLDLYSTSQTKRTRGFDFASLKCIYNSPYIAYQQGEKNYVVVQGNCHHWDCPRCGTGRAKAEYWRIVAGSAEIVQSHCPLWFITVTTRGAGLSVGEAEANYLLWTNRFLSRLRMETARHGRYWSYVQVTERQTRRHPHSHILTTYEPSDAVEGVKENWHTVNGRLELEYVDALRSDKLQAAVCESGLGEQYDVSEVRDSAAVSRYIGKYLFKQTLLTTWPKSWKRVRYAHTWPKNDELETTDGFVLLSWKDWEKLAKKAVTVRPGDMDVYEYASWKLYGSDVVILKPKVKE